MAKTTKPLTNTEVSKAKYKSKEYNIADGLALRVKPDMPLSEFDDKVILTK